MQPAQFFSLYKWYACSYYTSTTATPVRISNSRGNDHISTAARCFSLLRVL